MEWAVENPLHHLAIIMDGNGRWASQRGLPRIAGHRQGMETARQMVSLCGERRIPYLTLFAFSSENWNRPSAEVRLLMDLLYSTLHTEVAELNERQVRLRLIGDRSRFSEKLRQRITAAEEQTCDNQALQLTIAVNYGGQWDITQACRTLARQVVAGQLSPEAVTPTLVESHLCTAELPPPDLFIRTGGEQRISNFLLWQLAYTELFFCDTFWPDFDEHCLNDALCHFAGRQRRFGQTGDQVGTGSVQGVG